MRILAIDPGATTGIAHYFDGKILELMNETPLGVLDLIKHIAWNMVIFEDSTMIGHIYTAPSVKGEAKLKIARNVGEIDAYCKLILQACNAAKVPFLQISPKGKGKKLNAAEFAAITKWSKSSNQHQRDAAMVGWPYRMMVKK